MRIIISLIASALLISGGVEARSRAVIEKFQGQNACPATGIIAPSKPCPGWVVDHGIPLCAGGKDEPHNLFWQEKKVSYKKDRDERALCRELNRLRKLAND